MIPADIEKRRQLTQAAIIDALSPLLSPKGIVAAHVVVFVACDDEYATPVSCCFALSPDVMMRTLPVAAEFLAQAEPGKHEVHTIAVAEKN